MARRLERVVVVVSIAFGWGYCSEMSYRGYPNIGVPGVETLVGPYSSLWGATMVAQVWMWSMFRHRAGTGSAVFF